MLRPTTLGRPPLAEWSTIAETTTWHQIIFTTDSHPSARPDSNPQFQQTKGRLRPRDRWDRLFQPFKTKINEGQYCPCPHHKIIFWREGQGNKHHFLPHWSLHRPYTVYALRIFRTSCQALLLLPRHGGTKYIRVCRINRRLTMHRNLRLWCRSPTDPSPRCQKLRAMSVTANISAKIQNWHTFRWRMRM